MIDVDLTRNIITFEGRSVALTPRCAELATCLARSFPDVVSIPDIYMGFFGRDEPLRADKILYKFAATLRHAVAPIGLGVAAFKTRGRAFYVLRDGLPSGAEMHGKTARRIDRDRIILALRDGGLTAHEIADWMNESRDVIYNVYMRAKSVEVRA